MMRRLTRVVSLYLFLALPVFAARAQSQWTPHYEFSISADRASAKDLFAIQILYPDSEVIAGQVEKTRPGFALSKITGLGKGLSLRYGLSLADKGYVDDVRVLHFATGTTTHAPRDISLIYLGVPVLLGYNVVNGNPGLKFVAEAGFTPDILLRSERSAFFNFNLRRASASYTVNLGGKYNFRRGYAVLIGGELAVGAANYANATKKLNEAGDFRPIITALKFALQL